MRQAAALADDYALARKSSQKTNPSRPTVSSNSVRQQEGSAANGQGQSQRSRPLIELEEARQMYGGQEMFSVWKIRTLDV